MTLSRRRAPLTLLLIGVALLAALLLIPWAVHAQSNSTAPTNLTAEVVDGGIALSWDAPTEDADSVTGYEVLRRRPRQGENSLRTYVADTGSATTTYTDTNATEPGKRYVYRVKALRVGEKSGRSNYVRVDLPESEPEPASTPEPTPAPTPEPTPEPTPQTSTPDSPTGLTASSVSHDSVTLSWDDPDDDSITGYRVLRRSRDGDEYEDWQGAAEFVAVIDDTGSPAASYTDTSVTMRTRYVYRVQAISAAGLSERSTYRNVETPAEPVTTTVVVVPPEQPEEPEFALQTDTTEPGGDVWDDNGVRRLRMLSTTMTVGSTTMGSAAVLGFASRSPLNIGSLVSTMFDSGSWGCPVVSIPNPHDPLSTDSFELCRSAFTEMYFETVGGTTTLLVGRKALPALVSAPQIAGKMPEATILFIDGVKYPVSWSTYAGTPGVCYENGDYCYPYGHTHSWRRVAAPTFSTGDVVTVWLYGPDLSQ